MTSQAAGMYSQQAVTLRRQAVPTSQQEEMHMSTRSQEKESIQQTVIPSQQAEMTVTSLDRPEKHVYTYQEMLKANL